MLKWLRNRKQRRIQAAQQAEADAKQRFLRVREVEQQREQQERDDRERDEQARNTRVWADRVGESMQLQKLLNFPDVQSRDEHGQGVLRRLKAIKPIEEGYALPAGNWPKQYLELHFVDTNPPIKDHIEIGGTLMVGFAPDEPSLEVNAYADLDDPLNTARLHRNRQREAMNVLRLLGERLNTQLLEHGWRITHIALERNFEDTKVSRIGNTTFRISSKDNTSYLVAIPESGLFNEATTAGE
jgi:hypothetical protein